MSVNELAEKWRELFNDFSVPKMEAKERDDEYMSGRITGRSDMLDECAFDLDEIARTAWNPVSEPPTEANDTDLVLVWQPGWTECMVEKVGNVRLRALRGDSEMRWARQRDVVLIPPQGGE